MIVLIMFDDMTVDMKSNEILSCKVTELLLRGSKINISFAFTSQSYFQVPRTIRLNATHYYKIKIPNKKELNQIASNHSSGINFKNFMKFYRDYSKESYSLLVNNATLSSDNPLRFRKNLLQNEY